MKWGLIMVEVGTGSFTDMDGTGSVGSRRWRSVCGLVDGDGQVEAICYSCKDELRLEVCE